MKILDRDLLSDTPIVAVDLDVMEKNIHWLANLAKEAKVKLRPHTKTHKSPYIAQLQLEAGAAGITTATLGEAEVMANAGIQDILIAFPILGRRKLHRFSELLKRADVIVALDEYSVAKGLNDVGEAQQKKIPIYVDVDAGYGRMGKSPEESIQSIIEIAKLPFIEVIGLMSHTGHAYRADDEEGVKNIAIEEATILYNTKLELEKNGVEIREISVGATATAKYIKEIPYITEVRAGMYVFNDRNVVEVKGAEEKDCSLTIFATIISRPSNDRLIIDAGSKTLSSDTHKGGGYGKIIGHDNLSIVRMSEEHGIIQIQGETNLQVGDVIEIIPNHVCPVVNLTDSLYGFRKGVLERVISIKARGKIR